jgi:hypothetical protein
LLEAARSDAGAFERSWSFLRSCAEADVFEEHFARSVLSLNFAGHCRTIAVYVSELVARDGADVEAVLRPLVEGVRVRAEFVAQIAEDGGAVRAGDVEQLVAAISVAREVPEGWRRVAPVVERIVRDVGEIRPEADADAVEVAKLTRMLEEMRG